MWQLAAKALLSGALIVAIAEIGKRLPTLGALIASLPLVSVLGMILLWQQRPEGTAISQADLDKSLRKVQVAKSEFYYDPRNGGPRDWSGIKEEALWNLRWRARLRRVSQPNATLARFFSGPGLGPIMSQGSGTEIGSTVRNVLTASPEELAQWTAKNVGPVPQTSRTGGIVH